MSAATQRYRFGVFELDAAAGELRKSGTLIRVAPQPFKLLLLLTSRPGELVTREEIREAIWGKETYVDFDQGLNVCMRQIRAAISDAAATPRYVETLPRRGYRFIAQVQAVGPPGDVDVCRRLAQAQSCAAGAYSSARPPPLQSARRLGPGSSGATGARRPTRRSARSQCCRSPTSARRKTRPISAKAWLKS